jgi:hypothetical protein
LAKAKILWSQEMQSADEELQRQQEEARRKDERKSKF